MYQVFYQSPIGVILIKGTDEFITNVDFVLQHGTDDVNDIVLECKKQLEEYFLGERKVFTVKIKYEGTIFQENVWQALLNIPYNNTVSYKDIAIAINNPKAVRAVGNANNKNKISIIIPCHRVIGANNKLVGYGGGLWRKEWLIAHEKKFK